MCVYVSVCVRACVSVCDFMLKLNVQNYFQVNCVWVWAGARLCVGVCDSMLKVNVHNYF